MTSLADKVARYGVGRATPINAETTQEMAALITQLWDEREQNRTVMEQALAELELCRPEHVTRPLIAAIDKALGETK